MRSPLEPVSTSTLSMVAQVVVPGWHSFTLAYGILNVPPFAAAGPGPTVIATTFDTAAPLELLLELPLPLELPPELLELLEALGTLALVPPPPPPQPARTHAPSNTVQQRRWLMQQPRY